MGDFVPAVAEETGAESKHGLCAKSGPSHASLFHALLNQGFGSGFDGAAADGEAGLAIGSVVHAPSVFPQVSDILFEFWRRLCGVGVETQDATEEKVKRRAAENTLTPFYPRRAADEEHLNTFLAAEDAEGPENTLTPFCPRRTRRAAENPLTPFCPRRTRRGTENTLTPFYPRRTRRGTKNTLTPFCPRRTRRGTEDTLATADYGRRTRVSGEKRANAARRRPAYVTF